MKQITSLMKQIISPALILCIVLSLAACASGNPKSKVSTDKPSTSAPTESPTQTSGAVSEEKTPIAEDISALLPQEGAISCMALDENSLYLLIQDNEGHHHLSVRDLDSEYTQSYPISFVFDFAYSMNVLADKSLAIIAIHGESCCILSLSGQGELLRELPVENWQMQFVPIVDTLRGELWYADEDGTYFGISISDGSRRSFSHEGWLHAARDGILVFSQADSTILYHADTAQEETLSWVGNCLTFLEFGGSYQRQDCLADITPSDMALVLDYSQPEQTYQLDGVSEVLYISPSGTVFTLERQENDAVLRALQMDAGLCLGQWHWDSHNGFSLYRQADNGSVFAFHGFDGNQDILYLWRYGELKEEALEVNRLTLDALPAMVQEISDRIQEYSGFSLHVQPGDLASGSEDYSFSADFSYLQSYLTLLDMERILTLFPQDMLHALYGEYEKGLDIYFSTQFVPISSESISTTNALTYLCDQRWVIVLTAGSPWDLPHEMMHVMQDRLFELEQGQEWLSYSGYWNELNPEGFTYFDSYHYDESMEPDRWTWGMEDDIWFIDAYSKTFAKEDLCRIFEYLFLRDINYFENAPHLQEKAKYLCAMLRAVYGCEGAVWERGFDIPPLETYEKAVREYTDHLVPVG